MDLLDRIDTPLMPLKSDENQWNYASFYLLLRRFQLQP